MLEIILVYFLCKGLGGILRAKGRNPLVLQILLVVCWLGGEFAGGVVAGIVQAIRNPGQQEFQIDASIYLFALGGAALGAGFVYLIAYILPPAEQFSPRSYASQSGEKFAQQNYNLPPTDPNNPYSSPRN